MTNPPRTCSNCRHSMHIQKGWLWCMGPLGFVVHGEGGRNVKLHCPDTWGCSDFEPKETSDGE